MAPRFLESWAQPDACESGRLPERRWVCDLANGVRAMKDENLSAEPGNETSSLHQEESVQMPVRAKAARMVVGTTEQMRTRAAIRNVTSRNIGEQRPTELDKG